MCACAAPLVSPLPNGGNARPPCRALSYPCYSTYMRLHLALVVLVGCGGGSGSEPVVLHAARTKLAAIQDGDSWKPIALDAAGNAKLSLDGPTLIVTVCDDAAYFNYYTVGVGPGADDVKMYCGETKPSAHVTIAAPQTTNVFFGLGQARGGETTIVGQGTYDVVAIDTSMSPARAEIRRGIAVTGDMMLTFDLAATGMPMVKPSVAVTGITTAPATVQIGLTVATTTESPTSAYWLAATDAWILPPALLRPDDEHRVYASTSIQSSQRSASRDVDGTETSISLALPPDFTTAEPTFGALPTLTWQGDPRLDSVYFGINTQDLSKLWDINLFPSWAEAGGQTSTVTLPDPHMLPGWSAAWDLPTNGANLKWYMFAYQDAKPDHLAVSRSGSF